MACMGNDIDLESELTREKQRLLWEEILWGMYLSVIALKIKKMLMR